MLNLKQTYAGVDPILTTLAQGYTLPETSIANFILPVVDTPTRAGRILRFGKEAFAVGDYRRAYGTNIPAVQSRFDSVGYVLEQEVIAWELPEEVIENAGDGPAQVDLRVIETENAMKRIMNSYEKVVADVIATTDIYEDGLAFATWTAAEAAGLFEAAGNAPWSEAGRRVKDVLAMKRAVADQIAMRPNSMVLGVNVFDMLMDDAGILDRIKYTSDKSVDTAVLGQYFGLERGLKVAEGRYLADDGMLKPIFPENGVLMFYSPGTADSGVMPKSGMSNATPAFGYTYQLTGTPQVRPEYMIRERRVVRAEVTVERSAQVTAMGNTGLCGGGVFIENILA